ncbi:MAG: ATP-grasp domain-containing protein [Chloroflexota bacterium]
MNILITCAGQRGDLIQIFQAALGTGRVVACDMDPAAPALAVADRRGVVPRVDDGSYVERLLELCAEERVDLLFSLNDFEIALLAREAERFRGVGTRLVIADPATVDACLDKWASFELLAGAGMGTPLTFLGVEDALRAVADGTVGFPLIVKSRWGTSSLGGIEVVHDARELELVWELGNRRMERLIARGALPGIGSYFARLRDRGGPTTPMLIQERAEGPEYGLDVVNDLDGRYQATLMRHKQVVRGSEADVAVTVASEELEALGRRLGELVGQPGNLNCDVIESPRGLVVIDLNPRFGTSYPYTQLAGADVPAALVAWAMGTQPDPRWLRCRTGLTIRRTNAYVVMDDRS